MTRNRQATGFTLVELLVVMAIIAVLAGLLLPALARAKEKSKAIDCLSNLKQWSLAVSLYVDDNDDFIPRRGQGVQPLAQITRSEDWFNCLPPYLGVLSYSNMVSQNLIPKPGDKSIFVCSGAKFSGQANFLSYGMNMYLSPWNRPQSHKLSEIPHPATLAFLADGPLAYSSTVPSALPYSVQARHDARANVTFLDGHARSFAADYLGCGTGGIEQPDVHWQTETAGVNQLPVP